MKVKSLVLLVVWCSVLLAPVGARAQTPAVPRVISFNGQVLTASGAPRTGNVLLTFALYEDQTAGTPLWTEQQGVALDAQGRYTVILGSLTQGGMPAEIFNSGRARWLGVAADAETEQPRFLLVSVTYALKASDADTVGGKAPTEFVLTTNFNEKVGEAIQENRRSDVSAEAVTMNYVQKGNGSGGTTDSAIYEVGGNVGIGTTTPTAALDVGGNTLDTSGILTLEAGGRVTTQAGNDLNIVAPNTRSIFFKIASPDAPRVEIDNIGRLGLGLSGAPPSNLLDVSGTTISFDGILSLEAGGRLTTTAGNDLNIDVPANRSLNFKNGGSVKMTIDGGGNVMVNGNIGAKYQDVAEWVETSSAIEPGTVVIVDPARPNQVIAAPKAYDSRVAGAVSRQPGLVLGEKSDTKAMVAQSGRVRIKVDARYGAIKIGDLLVTSPTPGYAMKSKPVRVAGQAMHRPGTLLGKALEALPNGQGEILVLLTLQ